MNSTLHFLLMTSSLSVSLSLGLPVCLSLSPSPSSLSLSPSLEQYDAFVKFSHDQVERRFAESAFSCKHRMFLIIIIIIIACCFIQMCHESFSLFFLETNLSKTIILMCTYYYSVFTITQFTQWTGKCLH